MARVLTVRGASPKVLFTGTKTDSGSPYTSETIFPQPGQKGVRLLLEVTAASGASPTLDVKIQVLDEAADVWHDLPGAVFSQTPSTVSDMLTVYPGIAETANSSVSDVIVGPWRAVATIGGTTPSFTFTLTAEML